MKGAVAAFVGAACIIFNLWFVRMSLQQWDHVGNPISLIFCDLLAMVPAVLSIATAKSYFSQENRDD